MVQLVGAEIAPVQPMAFAVKQEAFEGPLSLLSELIDSQKLPITQVSLAHVADDFLAYLDSHDVPPDELADFLLVASRLIYLKSRELMPYLRIDEEENAVGNLEEQLRIYREFVAASQKLEAQFMLTPMVARPFVRLAQEQKFTPAPNVTKHNLVDAFRVILKRLEPFFALRQTSMDRVKSVEERLSEMMDAVKSRVSMRFHEVVAGAKSKADVVVSFLALLELLRRRIVKVSQKGGFGDIDIERV